MKMLKVNHAEAQSILGGKRTTWRLFDDKDLSVNDAVKLVDKVSPSKPDSWKVIGVVQITKIVEKQINELTQAELDRQGFENPQKLLKAFSLFYSRKLEADMPIKVLHFNFTPEERDGKSVDKSTMFMTKAKLFADGGSRGNPGPSASGFVILDMDDRVVVKKGTYLGITTNNQAEYQAVKFGLEEALNLGIRELYVYLDSLLVVNHMSGVYKVRNRDLWPIHAAIKDLAKRFHIVNFKHVPREMNKLADKAVNETLDEALGAKR
ncbi:MAG: reverse transcriptase-like protein [Candidatus Saccharimonadales bacterium]